MTAFTDMCSAVGAIGSCAATYLAFMATRKQAAIAELQFRKESARDAGEVLGAAFDVYHAISRERPGTERLRTTYLQFVLATRKARILFKDQQEVVSALQSFRAEVDFIYHRNELLVSSNVSLDEKEVFNIKNKIEEKFLGLSKYITDLENALVNHLDVVIDPDWVAVDTGEERRPVPGSEK